MSYTIERVGLNEAAFLEVFGLLLEEHAEIAHAPLNLQKAREYCYRILQQGMAWLVRDDAGNAVGHLALKEVPLFYSDQVDLFDAWIYVQPAHRKGEAGKLLVRAAEAEGNRRGQYVFLRVANPKRNAKRTTTTLMSEMHGWKPCGYDLLITSGKG